MIETNSAVEEMIRFDTPAPFVFRIAKEDLTLGGKTIPASSVIALGLGAANHDPEKFENRDRFEITRSPNEHLGFGPAIPRHTNLVFKGFDSLPVRF